jgi:hypothetical protein
MGSVPVTGVVDTGAGLTVVVGTDFDTTTVRPDCDAAADRPGLHRVAFIRRAAIACPAGRLDHQPHPSFHRRRRHDYPSAVAVAIDSRPRSNG